MLRLVSYQFLNPILSFYFNYKFTKNILNFLYNVSKQNIECEMIIKFSSSFIFLLLIYVIPTTFISAQSLKESIHKGLENSNSLYAASLEWASLNEKLKQSFAGKDLVGTLSGSLSETYSGNSQNYNNSFSNSVTATLSKKIFDGGVGKSSEAINNLNIDKKSIEIKILEQKIILEIINSHLDVFLSQKISQLREKNYLRVKEQVDANKARFIAGAINKTSMAESEARLARANSQLIEANLDLNNSIQKFIKYVGETPVDLTIPSEVSSLPKNEESALARAEKFSLIVALAKLNLSINKAQYDSLISSVMPNITTSLSGSITDSTKNGNNEGLTLSLSIRSPIFYTPSTSSKNRELVALAKALNYNLNEAIKLTNLNVKVKLNNLTSKKSIILAVQEELSAAKIAAEATLKENQFGAKTTLDVLDSDINVLNSEISLWRAKCDLIRSSFEVLAETGELHTESLGLKPTAPQYNYVEIVAPPLPSPFSVINPNRWIK